MHKCISEIWKVKTLCIREEMDYRVVNIIFKTSMKQSSSMRQHKYFIFYLLLINIVHMASEN